MGNDEQLLGEQVHPRLVPRASTTSQEAWRTWARMCGHGRRGGRHELKAKMASGTADRLPSTGWRQQRQ